MKQTVPPAVWLAATPQLVSRICHRNSKARDLVQQLLARLLRSMARHQGKPGWLEQDLSG